jgi:hypothetical protein
LRTQLFALRLKEENDIAQSKNIKRFFKFCNGKLKVKVGIGALKSGTRNIVSDEEKCDHFADHFSSFYVDYDRNCMDNEDRALAGSTFLDFCEITVATVCTQLEKLPLRISTSPDGLPYLFLRKAANGLAVPLTIMFNTFLLRGEVPDVWKIGWVRPIFKKGSRHSVENYRPVCLTSSVSKVMERIVRKQLLDFLLRHNKISADQHGFLPRRSTQTALISSFNDWHRALDAKQTVSLALIDLSRAFDSINLEKLFMKLSSSGIGGCLLQFLKSFLSGRSQKVVIGDCQSREYMTKSGIAQGTCLGPLMYIIYANDLPAALPAAVNCPMYADDSKLYTINEKVSLQDGLDALAEWAKKWDLTINVAKTQILKIGYKDDTVYSLNGEELVECETVTDLGITYDGQLSFKDYIDTIAKRAIARGNFILKCFATRDLQVLTKLFQTYVRPIVEYVTPIWSPANTKQIETLEKVQKSFTLRCLKRKGLLRLSYEQRLQMMDLESLESRRKLADCTFVYKIMADKVHIQKQSFFTMSTRNNVARGHKFKLIFPPIRTQKFRDSFMIRVLDEWNRLDNAVIMSNTAKSFQKKLKDNKAV